jgi:hypothetical protein
VDKARFIVNVSAMEGEIDLVFLLTSNLPPLNLLILSCSGKFYRFKSPNHPHTNMAKVRLFSFSLSLFHSWPRINIMRQFSVLWSSFTLLIESS